MKLRLRLLANAVLGMLREDPRLFLTQVTRRFLPPSLRPKGTPLGRSHQGPGSSSPRTAWELGKRVEEITAIRRGAESHHAKVDRIPGRTPVGKIRSRAALQRRIDDEWGLLTPRRRLVLAGQAPSGHGIDVLHFLSNSLPFTQSGYTVRSHRVLCAQRESGISIAAATRLGYPVIVGSLAVDVISTVDGVPYHRLLPTGIERMPADRLRQQATELARLAQTLGPRILHTTTDYRNAYTVEAVARALGVPWVYEMRGQLENSWVARHDASVQPIVQASPRYAAWRAKETEFATRADGVVVLSEIQRQDLVERGVDEAKIVVVRNAFDWPAGGEHLERERARALLGLPEARVWIGSVSSLVDYEGFETLVHALGRLVRDGVDARAAIVGDGVTLPHLIRLRAELGLEDRLILPGRVPIEQSHTWYQAFDLFAVPRKDTPVCRAITPIKPLEALACGTPVLASDLPALREITSSGGIFLPPGDPEAWSQAIAHTLPGSDPWAEASQGAERAARYASWQNNARIYGDLYRRLGA